MYIIIAGAGRVGLNLARSLMNEGLDVTIIENNVTKCEEISEEVDALVLQGDATSVEVLEDANIFDADFFVAATGSDPINLLISVLVKNYDNVKKIIARVNELEHENAFKKVGVDITVSPESTVASYLERIITKPKIADLIVLGRGSTELLDLTIENKNLVGKTVGEVSPTDEYIVCAVYNEEKELIIPQKDTVFHMNQKISVLTLTESVSEVTQLFIS